MIVIGYPGIGKSTLAEQDLKYIDLESSCFRNKSDQSKPENWHIYYCQMAEYLSAQGYIVFVSSHKEIQNYFRDNRNEYAICIYPSILIADQWKAKLKERYENTNTDKNYRAWLNAETQYMVNISALMICGIPHVEINDMNYNLADLIDLGISAKSFYK